MKTNDQQQIHHYPLQRNQQRYSHRNSRMKGVQTVMKRIRSFVVGSFWISAAIVILYAFFWVHVYFVQWVLVL